MSDVDPAMCPLCQRGNRCGSVEGEARCWCFDATIPAEVLDDVPAEAKGLACICPDCVRAGGGAVPDQAAAFEGRSQ